MHSKILKANKQEKTTNPVPRVIAFSQAVLKGHCVKTNVSVIAGTGEVTQLQLLQIHAREMIVQCF